tara:strand:- start:2087 stop:2602 length:516 start_codon:yes stop_codon:yes gene_type:complete
MASPNVKIKGQKKLLKHIDKMKDPRGVFDDVFAKTSRGAVRELGDRTNKMTGATARGWQAPKRLGKSYYVVENNVKTADNKHLIVDIIDQGRKEVVPVRARMLYIPLTNKGRSKKAGEPVPEGLVFGVDYVFAKKSKAVKGTKFISKHKIQASRDLTRDIIKKIRSVHSGS